MDAAAIGELGKVSCRPAEQIQRQVEADSQPYLRRQTERAGRREQEANRAISFGVPYAEISGLAEEGRADLIATKQVGGQGARRLMMGSVTERLVELVPSHVLVVKRE